MKKVLVIDDHPDMLEFLMRQLEMLGFAVISANNGMEGVEKAMEAKPDLILMDIVMSRRDGLEATRIIRSNPQIKDIPILAVTALIKESELRGCIEAGCNDYLMKPFTIKQLRKKIQKLSRS